MRERIHGVHVDAFGRCAHYGSECDVVANRCATCGSLYACHLCHADTQQHAFGKMPREHEGAVMCGACGHYMGWTQYASARKCPSCEHPFNPGCHSHEHLYFLN